MTQYIQTDTQTANPTRVDLRTADDSNAPPFQALDRLNGTSQRIDAALSSLIGHLAPYCDEENLTATKVEEAVAEGRSGLERRIQREESVLLELAQNAESLIGRLRL